MNVRISLLIAASIVLAMLFNSGCGNSSTPEMMDSATPNREQLAPQEDDEQASTKRRVYEIFAKAQKEKQNGKIDFRGFYLGMPSDDAVFLAEYYGIGDDQLSGFATPITEKVYKMAFTLHGVRKVTNVGNTFMEIAQGVANIIGTMNTIRDEDYEFVGYKYENIDNQSAFISQENGLVLEDDNLVYMAKAELDRIWADLSKDEITKLLDNMVSIPGRDFAMCKYEVTEALWFAVMREFNFADTKYASYPVTDKTAIEAEVFIKKLNMLPVVKKAGVVFRLPTVDEWKYASRAGSLGDGCKLEDGTEITEDTLEEVAWYGDKSVSLFDEKFKILSCHPVGQKKPNAFGLYDMYGNASELTYINDSVHWVYICCGGASNSDAKRCLNYDKEETYREYHDRNRGFRLVR